MAEYWLRNATTGDLMLYVTADNLTPEQEQVIHRLIGRGRKKDSGTFYGIRGSLTVLFREGWNGMTAHAQRQRLAQMIEEDSVTLETPWAESYLVALGQVEFSREPGGGDSDIGGATIPVEEVI